MAQEYTIRCDRCGDAIASSPEGFAAARRLVEELGGTARQSRRGGGRGRDLCQVCVLVRMYTAKGA